MKIFVITPAWRTEKKKLLYKGINTLKKLGFEIINENSFFSPLTLKQKVNQLHQAFLNKKANIILAQRGGYGCLKLLPHIDFNIIKKNPKIFAGFSDLSVLLNVIYEKTKITTLHSPMVINFSNLTEFTKNSFINAINHFPNKNLFSSTRIKVYNHGITEGFLKGGNLITVVSLIGTPWEITFKNSILFLEEVDEPLYKVDRAITQLILTRKLNDIKGLILGNFRGLNVEDVYKIITTQIKPKYPVVFCNNIGHTDDKLTLPIGAKVELNTYKKSLVIKELNLPQT
ncbi:MAG: LD-carboxypeptidase [Endomicrobiia bacterium]